MDTHSIFVVLNYISVFIMFLCLATFSTHKESKMQKMAFTVCFCLLICCIGFLVRIEAQDPGTYIVGQKLIYAFVTYGMFSMFLFILEYCRLSIPGYVKGIFFSINTFMAFVVITMNHHHWFYKSFTVVDMGNYITLDKEYGFMHTVVIILFAVYMAATVFVAVAFSVKNIRSRTVYVWRLLIAVAIPCLSYIIPKLTGMENDLQPIAFAIFMLMVAVMVYKNNIYDVNNLTAEFTIASLEDGVIIINYQGRYKGCNGIAKKLFPILNEVNLDCALADVSPDIADFINGDKNELISENKIYRFESKNIKDNVGKIVGEALWFKDITIERGYTNLLKEKNIDLKSQVENLSIISYRDDLTGIRNRRCFEAYLDELRIKKNIDSVTVIAMDINCLKETNDKLGHAAGDEQIRAAADIITDIFGKLGRCFRTGGDEFFVITDNSTLPYGELIDKLTRAMKDWRGVYPSDLSVSYGLAKGYEHKDKKIDELLIIADQEMYKCKKEYYETIGVDRRKHFFFEGQGQTR